MAVPVAISMLVLLGWILVLTVLKNVEVSEADLDAVRALLAPPLPMYVHPEPVERWLFVLLCLAAPLCALAALGLTRLLNRWASDVFLKPSVQTGFALLVGLGTFATIFVKTSLGFWLFPFQERGFFFEALPRSDWANLALILLTAATLRAASPFSFLPSWRGWLKFPLATRNQRRIWGVCVALLGTGLVFLPRGLSMHSVGQRIHSPLGHSMSEWAFRIHFQAVSFGLTQVFAGKALSVATPLYGGYAQFLLPIFRCIGLSVFKFSLVMTTLFAIALASSTAVVARFVRQPLVLCFATAAILYTLTNAWSAGKIQFDPYFQYWPVRVFFPAISVPFFLWAARQTGRAPAIAVGTFCGMALSWNLDSGIAVAGATLFTTLAETAGRAVRRSSGRVTIWRRVSNIGCLIASLAAVFLGFSWYLQWAAHGVRPLHTTAEYQRLYYEFGFMMMAIPDGLHPWTTVLAVYLLAMMLGMRGFLDGRYSPFTRLSVYLGILGAGLFTYYQGRSHDYNLIAAAWPALLLGFLLADRLFRAIRAGVFAPNLRWLAFAVIYYGIVCVFLLPNAVTSLAKLGLPHWRAALRLLPANSPDPMQEQIDFIRAHVGGDHKCVILTRRRR